MARRPNRTVIGAFVVIALVLGVAGVLLFGSGRLFAGRQRYVLYFRESLSGLGVGAPVTLHGVKIGSVSDISVEVNPEGPTYLAPVVIEVNRDTFRPPNAAGKKAPTRQKALDALIEKGLRAQLQTRSYITGLIQVSLDFYPGTPVTLVHTKTDYPQIPTIPTQLARLSRTLENLPVQQLADNLVHLTHKADELLSSPQLADALAQFDQSMKNLNALSTELSGQSGQTIEELRATLHDIRGLTADVGQQVGQLSASARATLEQADQKTLPQLNALLKRADSRVAPLADELDTTIASARSALDAATKTLQSTGRAADGLQTVEQELRDAIGEVASAARAVRELADYLERHPESLLHGKGGN